MVYAVQELQFAHISDLDFSWFPDEVVRYQRTHVRRHVHAVFVYKIIAVVEASVMASS